ncbi:hypothetical protein KVC18_04050 [Helicobacter pylori]|nr:hypothetical protein KVC18_04050 [Helicobacter pylori]
MGFLAFFFFVWAVWVASYRGRYRWVWLFFVVFFKSTPQPNDASGVFQIHATAKRCKRCFSNPRHSQTMQAVFFNNVFLGI